jgi:hypothetical protein
MTHSKPWPSRLVEVKHWYVIGLLSIRWMVHATGDVSISDGRLSCFTIEGPQFPLQSKITSAVHQCENKWSTSDLQQGFHCSLTWIVQSSLIPLLGVYLGKHDQHVCTQWPNQVNKHSATTQCWYRISLVNCRQAGTVRHAPIYYTWTLHPACHWWLKGPNPYSRLF